MIWNNSIALTGIIAFWLKDARNPVQRGVSERNHLVVRLSDGTLGGMSLTVPVPLDAHYRSGAQLHEVFCL